MYPYGIVDKETVIVECRMCCEPTEIVVGVEGLKRLEEDDLLIQLAIPHVTPELREMLISGTCPDCYKKMFAFMDDDYDDDYGDDYKYEPLEEVEDDDSLPF